MQTANVVLITYGEDINSYPKFSPLEDLKTLKKELSWWDEIRLVVLCIVFIFTGSSSMRRMLSIDGACRAFLSKQRWAITGTPVHDRIPVVQVLESPPQQILRAL